MELNAYSIYDSAAKAYTQPFFMQNDGLAIRAFQGNVNAEIPNNISDHPDQFTLYNIGQWDDKTAQFIPQTPSTLGNGKQYKETEATQQMDLLEQIRKVIQEEIK